METRTLGTNGPQVSAIGLGCMGMSAAYGERDDAESTRTLQRALDLGVNHFDTADIYGMGRNEELLAPVVQQRRDQVFLATKCGNRLVGPPPGPGARQSDIRLEVDSSASWVRQACQESLQRLGIDHIDLYYLHRRNPEVPIEETMSAMAELVAAGKVRYVGLSEVNPHTLRKAHAVHPVTAVQLEYSLFTRGVVEGEMLDTCRELGVSVVAYSPVGRGMLTGTLSAHDQFVERDWRRQAPQFSPENLAHNLQLVDTVSMIAGEIGCTPAQAALAWVLAQGDDLVAIPGTKRVRYLEENVAAASLELTATQLSRLASAVPPDQVAGDRYPASGLRTVGH